VVLAAFGLSLGAVVLTGSVDATPLIGGVCKPPKASASYEQRIQGALAAKHDVWGERLLAAASGPSYDGARRYLAPLLYALGPGRQPITSSGVYYLPFSFPRSLSAARGYALHVADGSEIITRRIGGRSLAIDVGRDGRERYGSCLVRLTPARLGDGYLPILDTSYVDAAGVRYRQESFAGHAHGTTSLVSYLHLAVDARDAVDSAAVRLVPSMRSVDAADHRLVHGKKTLLVYSDGGTFDGSAIRYTVRPGDTLDVYAAWLHGPTRIPSLDLDSSTYESARERVARFWQDGLATGAQFLVPDKRVLDAERNLLIQQLAYTWRYSIGNSYEELSFAEAQDVAQGMAGYGYGDAAKEILQVSLERLQQRFTDWRAGESLVAAAAYYRLDHDRTFLEDELPRLRRIVDVLGGQIEHTGRGGLLDREVYSSDISRRVYGLHGQAVVWQGLGAMARIWAHTGHPRIAARARALVARLAVGLRAAIRSSDRRLPDGSLFIPAALLEGAEPFDHLTDTREGSYWNLVAPYALASGFFPPHGREARGLLQYLLGHSSRLLGLVRAGGYLLYDRPSSSVSGIDQVYGVNVSRFLADNDEPDQLVLSLYGALAAALTPDTFVSGEGATVAPLNGAYFRTMYLPPNSGGNAAFLETLRLMLVHESRGPEGAPRGLELAFATPRMWLRDGKALVVQNAPTSFGDVSFSIERHGNVVHATIDAPATPSLELRLRLPRGERITATRFAGGPLPVDTPSATIDLSGHHGHLELEVSVR